jgi:hypothetical protein
MSYGLGRLPVKSEGDWVKATQDDFKQANYRLPDLMRQIATSPEFYHIAPPQMGALDNPASKLAQEIQQ